MPDQGICAKCDQEVVRQRWFWIRPDEVGTGRATFCPAGGLHEVDEDE